MLRQLVKVIVEVGDEKEIQEYRVEQLRFKRKHKHNKVDVQDEAAPVLAAIRIGIIPVPVPRSRTLSLSRALANPESSTASIPKQKRAGSEPRSKLDDN